MQGASQQLLSPRRLGVCPLRAPQLPFQVHLYELPLQGSQGCDSGSRTDAEAASSPLFSDDVVRQLPAAQVGVLEAERLGMPLLQEPQLRAQAGFAAECVCVCVSQGGRFVWELYYMPFVHCWGLKLT